MEKSTRLDRLDRLVDDFSIDWTWQIFDRLHRLHRSTTGSNGLHMRVDVIVAQFVERRVEFDNVLAAAAGWIHPSR